jgi:hypothetical protein
MVAACAEESLDVHDASQLVLEVFEVIGSRFSVGMDHAVSGA